MKHLVVPRTKRVAVLGTGLPVPGRNPSAVQPVHAASLGSGLAQLRPKRPQGLTLKLTSRFTLESVNGIQVSELARRSGLTPSTVRFYERIGLLSSARRAPNGYRE